MTFPLRRQSCLGPTEVSSLCAPGWIIPGGLALHPEPLLHYPEIPVLHFKCPTFSESLGVNNLYYRKILILSFVHSPSKRYLSP